jgi:hypothetical protein
MMRFLAIASRETRDQRLAYEFFVMPPGPRQIGQCVCEEPLPATTGGGGQMGPKAFLATDAGP